MITAALASTKVRVFRVRRWTACCTEADKLGGPEVGLPKLGDGVVGGMPMLGGTPMLTGPTPDSDG